MATTPCLDSTALLAALDATITLVEQADDLRKGVVSTYIHSFLRYLPITSQRESQKARQTVSLCIRQHFAHMQQGDFNTQAPSDSMQGL